MRTTIAEMMSEPDFLLGDRKTCMLLLNVSTQITDNYCCT
jgi:hypothetical protein